MKNPIRAGVALLVVVAASVIGGTAVVRSQSSRVAKTPEQINRGTIATRSAFDFPDYTVIPESEIENRTAQVLEQRITAVSKLVMQIEDPQMPRLAKAETIYLLGCLQAPEAVTALIENINFVDDRVIIKTRRSDRGGFIARRALAKIGEPSARWIYLILADDHNLDTVRFNTSQVDGFAEVLARIETREGAINKLKLERAGARNAQIKTNFDLVIEALKKRDE